MVLLHGKDVLPLSEPKPMPKEHEGWLIEETNEWFPNYEHYLTRMDFYNKRQFTDAISRHTKLTFFEALRTESHGTQAIEADFPEPLRGPILCKVHLDTTGRLEDLVASLFSAWSNNILPGENVLVYSADQRMRSLGIVRDKTIISAGKDRPEMTRFFVRLPDQSTAEPVEMIVDQDHIVRKPKTFTKAAITQFLRYTVDRERYEGAPWVVKQPYAERYGLDTRIPHHLTQEAIAQERRALAAARKGRPPSNLPSGFMFKNNTIVPKPGYQATAKELQAVQERFARASVNGQQVLEMRPGPNGRSLGGQFGEIQFSPSAPPPVKYPIEDLDLEPKRTASQRPPLKDFTKFCPFPDESVLQGKERLLMSSIGPLLEVWNTFQVFGPSFFFIDGFTLDDFLGALLISSEKVPCQLFHELHCAVLQRLVDEDGEVLVKSLSSVLTAEEQKAEDDEASEPGSPSAPNGSGDSHDDAEMSDAPQPQSTHRAADMAEVNNWVRIVQAGKLSDGGWQVAMVGMLEQLSRAIKVHKPACDAILEQLAPLDYDATRQVARMQYAQLGVNLRIQALELATRMVIETHAFKSKMNEIMGGATATRKEKTSIQTQRKNLSKQLEDLNQQRKLKRPDNMPDISEQDAEDGELGEDELERDEEYSERSGSDDSSDEGATLAMNRRQSDRMAILKRKREEEEELERVEKLEMGKKETADYMKILKDIRSVKDDIARCEEQIAARDDDLRENFCHRTKLIGRDRFINRYHWFERNGMPLQGDQDSSTVYGYANGRVWVQGGDALDRQGIIDLEPADEKAHRSRFKMTIKERRDLDEGSTQLNGADEWGYYDEPEEIGRLISWLKDKGEREKRLKKELVAWQEPIFRSMENLKQRIVEVGKRNEDHEERPQRGVALRKKAAAEISQIKYPCAIWQNSAALREFGMLLSEGRVEYPSEEENGGEKDEPAKKGKKGEARTREASAPPEKRTTRQGTRFAR